MTEAVPRWRLFPREIESDLNLYRNIDIGDWHEGRLSSRKLICYLDGLPAESWYKMSLTEFIHEATEEAERAHGDEVRGLIFAQLRGQDIQAENETTE